MQSGNWSRAHEVAQAYMTPDEANEVLSKHAVDLCEAGDLKHAEELYLAIGQYDSAISMYKKAGRRADMIRLVAKYRPDLLDATHAHLARELDASGKPREAEEHYLAAGDWKAAIAAYRSANMWEDALRVAKQNAGDSAAQQVNQFFCVQNLSQYIISLCSLGCLTVGTYTSSRASSKVVDTFKLFRWLSSAGL